VDAPRQICLFRDQLEFDGRWVHESMTYSDIIAPTQHPGYWSLLVPYRHPADERARQDLRLMHYVWVPYDCLLMGYNKELLETCRGDQDMFSMIWGGASHSRFHSYHVSDLLRNGHAGNENQRGIIRQGPDPTNVEVALRWTEPVAPFLHNGVHPPAFDPNTTLHFFDPSVLPTPPDVYFFAQGAWENAYSGFSETSSAVIRMFEYMDDQIERSDHVRSEPIMM
jgi:hypothetical protein